MYVHTQTLHTDLHRIRTDDLPVEPLGQLEAHSGLPDGRRARHDDHLWQVDV